VSLVAVRFDAAGTLAEAWADALLEAGAVAVDVADAHVGADHENGLDAEPDAPSSWRVARLTALFESSGNIDAALARASLATGCSTGAHTLKTLPADDWVRRTRTQFRPIQASNRIWIVPSWCTPVVSDALNLTIDPGLAFGTGSHASTRLCLKWLDANLVRGAAVLDYGCGSGILAIAASRLGAGSVTGLDIDQDALKASRSNARINGVKAQFMRPRNLRRRDFDIVLANILADPLERLAPQLARRVRTQGDIVLSGILETQADALIAVYSQWFNIGIWGRDDGWIALAGRRNDKHGG